MAKKRKPTFVEYGKGLIESNRIKIMADGRQIYYYEFEDNQKIPQALNWIKDYCDKKLTLEATLDLDKYLEPLTSTLLTKLKQLYQV